MSELKPCPFCGHDATLETKEQNWDHDRFEGERVEISCSNDDCDVSPYLLSRPAMSLDFQADESEAVEAWNERPKEEALTKHNRLLQLENDQLAKDKAELVDIIAALIDCRGILT